MAACRAAHGGDVERAFKDSSRSTGPDAPKSADSESATTVTGRIASLSACESTVICTPGATETRETWSEIYRQSARLSSVLADAGVGRGTRIAVLSPDVRSAVIGICATWIAGAILVPTPVSRRPERASATQQRLLQSRPHLVVADDETRAGLVPTGTRLVTVSSGPSLGWQPARTPPLPCPDDLALLQYTSGSTAEPKPVALTHRQLCSNMDALISRLSITSKDTIVSWLPLHHDMGLVGALLTSMIAGTSLVIGEPESFARSPHLWMQWVSEYRGTITAGPHSAYVAARSRLGTTANLDLSSLRVSINGAEPVIADELRDFERDARTWGLSSGVVIPSFGMAEVGIAALIPEPGSGMRTEWVSASSMDRDGRAELVGPHDPDAREMVLIGPPVSGLRTRVVRVETGQVADEREVGELQLAGPSVMSRGAGSEDEDDETRWDGSWLRTGDLAYSTGEAVAVCGRLKDVIALAGANIHPVDVERAVVNELGLRPNCVAAFGVNDAHGSEQLAVMIEHLDPPADARQRIRRAVKGVCGVAPRHIHFVNHGRVPRTSSGKLRRFAAREEYLRCLEVAGENRAIDALSQPSYASRRSSAAEDPRARGSR